MADSSDANLNDTNFKYVSWFRQSSPYINAHRGKTFVLMLPGSALYDENFPNIIHDIALLNSLGVKLILVHGARPQIDARLQQQTQASQEFHQRWRITGADQIPSVCQAVGEARFAIEAALSKGLPNSPMHGADIQVAGGNFVTARPMGVINGVDLQHTGKVRKINCSALAAALNNCAIVLLSPLGYSPTGEIFNLSFSEIATQVAIDIRAEKLIAYTARDGFRGASSELQRQLNLGECKRQLQLLKTDNDESQSLQACYDACLKGVSRGHIISYHEDGALLRELFTRDGSGTLVHRDKYEVVRQASIEDVRGLLELIEPLERQGALVRRSRELLESEIQQFTVVEKDGAIIACAALYPYRDDGEPFTGEGTPAVAELACVATHLDYQNGGRASMLLETIEEQARKIGVRDLFVLTTQAAHWFMEQGFNSATLEHLPTKKKNLYNFQRNSKVFIKQI